MKLLPTKGYMQVKYYKVTEHTGLLSPNRDSVYTVVAVSDESPLCKVGDLVVLADVFLPGATFDIARESDFVAWAEVENDDL